MRVALWLPVLLAYSEVDVAFTTGHHQHRLHLWQGEVVKCELDF